MNVASNVIGGIAWFLFGLALATGPATAQSSNLCDQALPAAARAALRQRFPRDQIVSASSLDADELAAWAADHPTDCPGIAHGTFAPGVTGYAISLVRRASPTNAMEALVLLRRTPEGYSVTILSPPLQSSGHTNVVSIAPPGPCRNLKTGKTVNTHGPVILYEAIGAGIIGYYFSDGEFHSLLLSE